MPLLSTRGAGSAKGFGFSVGSATIPIIGSVYQGGYFAGQLSTTANGVATHNLVVAPLSTGQSSKQWKTTGTSTSGTTSSFDGSANTAAMIAAGASDHPAADFCDQLTIGGYTDWYMPSIAELNICYFNLKPSTSLNYPLSGANNYSVPIRNNFTENNPGRTTATDFQQYNTQAYSTTIYWTSTQTSSSGSSFIDFGNGQLSDINKVDSRLVRAIRKVAL